MFPARAAASGSASRRERRLAGLVTPPNPASKLPRSRPFIPLLKPAGGRCNLRCRYCYYREKTALYKGSDFRMSEAVLDATLAQLLDAHAGGHATVAWQGGEPAVLGVPFYARAARLVERHRTPGTKVETTFQTNGSLIDAAWVRFFAAHDVLVGLSVDGPPEFHDRWRVDGRGRGSHPHQAAALLRAGRVRTNGICTVNATNVTHPLRVYRHLRDDLALRFLQFIPVLHPTEAAITGEAWGEFLVAILEEWRQRDAGEVYVQNLEATLAGLVGHPPLTCVSARQCGRNPVVEHTGDVYACDAAVDPAHLLGNVLRTPLGSLVESLRQREFGAGKADLSSECRGCTALAACWGGCPLTRRGSGALDAEAATGDGTPANACSADGGGAGTPDGARGRARAAAGRGAGQRGASPPANAGAGGSWETPASGFCSAPGPDPLCAGTRRLWGALVGGARNVDN